MMIVEEDIVQISLLWNAKLQDVWIYCSEMNKIMNLANEKKTIPIGEKVSANRAPYWLKYPKTVFHRNNSPRVDSI